MQIKTVQLILLCLLCSTSLLFGQNKTLEKAEKHFLAGEIYDAIPLYLKQLESNPTDEDIQIKLAECYHLIYDTEQSASWYEKAIQNGASAKYLKRYAQLLMQLGNYDEAKQAFQKYAVINPTVGKHYTMMCDVAKAQMAKTPPSSIERVTFNSNQADFSPTFYKHRLVYVSDRKDIKWRNKTGVKENPKQNYALHVRLDERNPDPAYHRGQKQEKNGENEGPIAYSGNGKWVAFVKNNYVQGIAKLAQPVQKSNIYIAPVNSNGKWGDVVAFPFHGDFANTFPYLSEDGKHLYFASNQPGGKGGFDIYMSTQKAGEWSMPTNLGYPVNSSGNEISPYLGEKGLYFSSDFHTGLGGQDVFMAIPKDGTWSIQNVGQSINSPNNDYGFIDNGKAAYFVSDREGVENIYKARLGKPNSTTTSTAPKIQPPAIVSKPTLSPTKPTVQQPSTTTPQITSTPNVTSTPSGASKIVSFKVIDADTKAPVESYLDLKACGRPAIFTDENGVLKLNMVGYPQGCTFTVKSKNGEYTPKEISVDNAVQEKNITITLYNRLASPNNNTASQPQMNDTPIKGEIYQGRISDGKTDIDLAKVLVKATNMESGISQRAYSNPEGIYELKLEANNDYLVAFSKEGYITYNLKIKTEDGTDKGILGSQLIYKLSGSNSKPTTSKPNITVPRPTVSTPTINMTGGSKPTAFSAGYAVQLMSLSANNNKAPRKLPSIKGMVQRVYVKIDSEYRRFRVGVYPTRAEAKQVQKYLVAKGFKGAFIVEEDALGIMEDVNL